MRLTVKLDYDVAQLIESTANKAGRSKTRIVNDALRQALAPLAEQPATSASCQVEIPPRPADESDHAAITEAMARYFGLPAPPPLLRVVRNED
ncbi:CopG family transcriptional regulator [Nocardia arthritidis]|uniref:Ribbon-helix-helix protein, CopG family n=1 Tax=Nocardia arthritidis TaxID=228602 RepID=A0A6G9YB98_9NOCA|nr:CopG family transcriptional regulator [Nocardia arthritidis]QIS10336.1 hypothetical protein F5544_12225 [Nocardia arthritidis]